MACLPLICVCAHFNFCSVKNNKLSNQYLELMFFSNPSFYGFLVHRFQCLCSDDRKRVSLTTDMSSQSHVFITILLSSCQYGFVFLSNINSHTRVHVFHCFTFVYLLLCSKRKQWSDRWNFWCIFVKLFK